MPSFINYKGNRVYQPSVLVDVNNNLISPSALGGKALLVVGDFPILQKGVPHTFTSTGGLELADVYPKDVKLRNIDKIWKNSIKDSSAVSESITYLNARPNTQATHIIKDEASGVVNLITLKANDWGDVANDIQINIKGPAQVQELSADGNYYRLTVRRPGEDDAIYDRGYPKQIKVTGVDGGAIAIADDGDGDPAISYDAVDPANDLASRKLTDFTTLSELVDYLNTSSELTVVQQGFDALPYQLDEMSKTFGPADLVVNLAAHSQAVVDTINELSSIPFSAEYLEALRKPLKINGGLFVNLAGGSAPTEPSAVNYQEVLQVMVTKDITSMTVMSEASAVHDLVAAHLDLASRAGRERNAWLGVPANQSLEDIGDAYVSPQNNQLMSIVGQGVTFLDYQGNRRVEASPMWMAINLLCLQGALPAAEPLTRKSPNILDTTEAWTREDDVNEAIKRGVVVIGLGLNNDLRVERSITTWRNDNISFNTEVNTRESVNTCLRELRKYLDAEIGSRILNTTVGRLLNLSENRLKQIREAGIIQDFANVKVRRVADTVFVDFDLAAVEPLNFIRITANLVREV